MEKQGKIYPISQRGQVQRQRLRAQVEKRNLIVLREVSSRFQPLNRASMKLATCCSEIGFTQYRGRTLGTRRQLVVPWKNVLAQPDWKEKLTL